MTDQERLASYIAVGQRAIDDFVALLRDLPDAAWSQPTDLPGWDVKAVASHVAHLESVLAGEPEAVVDIGAPVHLTAPTADYTERGVVSRRSHDPADIITEIRVSADTRFAALAADPPTDASAKPSLGVPGLSWTWETLLRNRALDVWMHEQDIRRAIDRPGGLDTPPALHTARYFAESLGYVVAKRAKAPAGTTVVFELTGAPPVAFGVTDEGRGVPLGDIPVTPTARIRLDLESYIVLAGGRREPADGAVQVEGDEALAWRILGSLSMTG
jgi:uncharacterized protein (TIGR03083 family)